MSDSRFEAENFHQEMKVVVNEIRGFIAMLYKFFSRDAEVSEWPLALEQLREIKTGVEVLLLKIELRGYELQNSTGELDIDSSRRENTADMLPDTYYSAEFQNIFDNLSRPSNAGRTFNIAVGRKSSDRSNRSANNQAEGQERRAGTSGNIESEFLNLLSPENAAASNMKRYRNFSNLHALFDLE